MAQQQQQQQQPSQTQPKHQHYADQTEQGLTGLPPPSNEVVQLESNSNTSAVQHSAPNPTATIIIHHHNPNTATMSRLQEPTTNSCAAKSTSSTGHRLLRRAFTLPRNPFQRLSSRKFLKVNGGVSSTTNNEPEQSNGTYVRTNGTVESPLLLISQTAGGNAWQPNDNEVVERSQSALQGSGERRSRGSWKKIIGRLAQQVTNVGVSVDFIIW